MSGNQNQIMVQIHAFSPKLMPTSFQEMPKGIRYKSGAQNKTNPHSPLPLYLHILKISLDLKINTQVKSRGLAQNNFK